MTAIALAAALKADLCQIYTDVDGVYTADPRIVPTAKKLPEISYDEMLELASLGAKVMQSRSVEFAKKFGVVFDVRSSLNENPGTIVKEETKSMEGVVVRGVALDKNQAKVTLVGVPDKPGVAARFSRQSPYGMKASIMDSGCVSRPGWRVPSSHCRWMWVSAMLSCPAPTTRIIRSS